MSDVDAIKEANKLLSILDKQLAYLREKHKAVVAEYLETPSRKNQFFYVSDARGVLSLHQDADFVCEAIICPTSRINSIARLKVEDLGSSRVMTASVLPSTLANPPVMVDGVEMIYAQQMIPGNSVLVSPARTFDDWFELSIEWLLPRGDTLRFTPEFATGAAATAVQARVILVGYKVY